MNRQLTKYTKLIRKKRRYAALSKNPNHVERYRATKKLAILPGTVPILEAMLKDLHPEVRFGAIEGLVAKKSESSAAKITDLLNSPNEPEFVKRGALLALGKLRCRDKRNIIEQFLADPSPYMRGSALKSLAAMGSVKSLPRALELLKDADKSVRQEAAFAIDCLKPNAHAELYQSKILDREFIHSKGVPEAAQEKSGSKTILLGGRLFGKEIKRIIPREAFLAWKRAAEAGILVEPILEAKTVESFNGADMMEVRAGVVKGHSAHAFLMNWQNMRNFGTNIRSQQKRIVAALEKIGVNHMHIHDRNFAVTWRRLRSGRFVPLLVLLDFDAATRKQE